MLKQIEHDLHVYVAFFVLPAFAFVNAGISLKGIGLEQIFHPVSPGVILGLFAGKQLGVFGFCFLRSNLSSQSYRNTATRLSFTVFACLRVPSLR